MDTFEFKNHFCLVMEYMGQSLCDRLKEDFYSGMDLETVRHYTIQLLEALQVLEKVGWIHGDLDPHNILLQR
jgi:serine/threonine protein kinase